MNDPILKLRLEMLNDNLQTALRMRQYLDEDLNALGIDTRLSDVLEAAFDHHANQQQDNLRRALDAIDGINATNAQAVRCAWSTYAELSERNAQIYREFLEAMLGLAIRRHQIDDSFCKIADELILSMRSLGVSNTMAIPASREAYSRTLARLVRMRFPEWTIWSLPLVAHEFAHVAIEDVGELDSFAKLEGSAVAAAESEYKAIPVDEREKRKNHAILRRTQGRVSQLLADAFAVYTIGPSYACSLILLRLCPIGPDSGEPQPGDAERATVVVEMLRSMAAAPPKPTRYDSIIQELEQQWSGMVARSGVSPLAKEELDALAELVGRIKDQLDRRVADKRYRPSLPGGGGWNTAYDWYTQWEQHAVPNKLPVPGNITRASKIHDALNAAWMYRLFTNPQSLEPVANATRALCDAIVQARSESAGRGGSGKGPRG